MVDGRTEKETAFCVEYELWNRWSAAVMVDEDEVRPTLDRLLADEKLKRVRILRRIGPGRWGPKVWEVKTTWNYTKVKEKRMSMERARLRSERLSRQEGS